MPDKDPMAALQAENARLAALLDAHGIEWQLVAPTAAGTVEAESENILQAGVFTPRKIYSLLSYGQKNKMR